MTGGASLIVHEVDLVQIDASNDDHGTLYVDLTVGDRDLVRVYRNFPVSLYEEWMNRDFAEDLYLSKIEPAYPCVEENDD